MKKQSQRGDTIIEVMLAMAVIGVVLGSAFGTTNRSLNIGRSAQERSEALKLAESQLELLKNNSEDPLLDSLAVAGGFCMKPPADAIGGVAVGKDDPFCQNLDSSGEKDNNGFYDVIITESADGVHQVMVEWPRIGAADTNKDTLTLYYRTGAL